MQTHKLKLISLIILLIFTMQAWAQDPQPKPEELPRKGDIVASEADMQELISAYNNFLFKQANQKRAEAEKKAADAEVSTADLLYQNTLLKIRSRLAVPDSAEVKLNSKQIFFRNKEAPKVPEKTDDKK